MSLSVGAQHFKNSLVISGLAVSVILKARSEGTADGDGHVPITYSAGTNLQGYVDDVQERPVNQQSEGIFIEESKLVDLAADATVHELDKLTINGIDYEVQNVTPYSTHLRVIARRTV